MIVFVEEKQTGKSIPDTRVNWIGRCVICKFWTFTNIWR